eukprot:scaffold485223_cov34-Prasinocladus_malaysianus.AAC.2
MNRRRIEDAKCQRLPSTSIKRGSRLPSGIGQLRTNIRTRILLVDEKCAECADDEIFFRSSGGCALIGEQQPLST